MSVDNKPLVSVIIPVYKVEKYIRRCVDSITMQSYENIEIILIDDGSPDKCPVICDEYAKKDNRVKVIHKENGGVSSARNKGLEAAKGEFICFVDADDSIPKNSVDIMVSDITNKNADLLLCSFNILTNKGTFFQGFENKTFKRADVTKKVIRELIVTGAVWAKLFKKEIIHNNSLLFEEDTPYGEDKLFLFDYIRYCDRIVCSDEVVYSYDVTIPGSAVSKFYEEFDRYSIKIFDEIVSVINSSDIEDKAEMISEIAAFYYSYCVYYYLTYTLDKKIAECRIKNLTDYFVPYTSFMVFTSMEDKNFSDEEAKLLFENDIHGFVKTWEHNMRKNYFNRYLRLKVKLLLKKYGLVKR